MNKIENKSYKTQRIDIIGIDVDVLSWDSTIKKIISWLAGIKVNIFALQIHPP